MHIYAIYDDVLQMEKPKDVIFSTNILFLGVLVNSNILGHIWETHSLIISCINAIFAVVILIFRIYGFANIVENAGIVLLNLLTIAIVLPIWV